MAGKMPYYRFTVRRGRFVSYDVVPDTGVACRSDEKPPKPEARLSSLAQRAPTMSERKTGLDRVHPNETTPRLLLASVNVSVA